MPEEELNKVNEKVDADRPESRMEKGASKAGSAEVEQELPDWTRQKQQADQEFKAAGLLDKPRNEYVSGTLGRVQIEDAGEVLVKGLPAQGRETAEQSQDSPSELRLKSMGEQDPTAKAMYDLRQGIKRHMPDGAQKENAMRAARESEKEFLGDKLASNITPATANFEGGTHPAINLASEGEQDSAPKISHGPDDFHTPVESGEILKPAIEAGIGAAKAGLEVGVGVFDDAMHPYRGRIGDTIRQIPEVAWQDAFRKFPQFKGAGLTEQQTIELMKAIVRNELFNYNVVDGEDDSKTKESGKPHNIPKVRPAGDATLGFSQLSMNGVTKRANEYPDQIGRFKGREAEALLDPQNTPILVAATLAHNLEMYRRHDIPITEETLAYSYNPPKGFPILPSNQDLKASDHVKNVKRQLDIIRGKIQPEQNER